MHAEKYLISQHSFLRETESNRLDLCLLSQFEVLARVSRHVEPPRISGRKQTTVCAAPRRSTAGHVLGMFWITMPAFAKVTPVIADSKNAILTVSIPRQIGADKQPSLSLAGEDCSLSAKEPKKLRRNTSPSTVPAIMAPEKNALTTQQ
eukprot:252859_1